MSYYPKASASTDAPASPASGGGAAVSASVKFPEIEERILKYWDQDGTFQASIDQRGYGRWAVQGPDGRLYVVDAATQVLPSSRALPITTLPQGWRVPLAVGFEAAFLLTWLLFAAWPWLWQLSRGSWKACSHCAWTA